MSKKRGKIFRLSTLVDRVPCTSCIMILCHYSSLNSILIPLLMMITAGWDWLLQSTGFILLQVLFRHPTGFSFSHIVTWTLTSGQLPGQIIGVVPAFESLSCWIHSLIASNLYRSSLCHLYVPSYVLHLMCISLKVQEKGDEEQWIIQKALLWTVHSQRSQGPMSSHLFSFLASI